MYCIYPLSESISWRLASNAMVMNAEAVPSVGVLQ